MKRVREGTQGHPCNSSVAGRTLTTGTSEKPFPKPTTKVRPQPAPVDMAHPASARAREVPLCVHERCSTAACSVVMFCTGSRVSDVSPNEFLYASFGGPGCPVGAHAADESWITPSPAPDHPDSTSSHDVFCGPLPIAIFPPHGAAAYGRTSLMSARRNPGLAGAWRMCRSPRGCARDRVGVWVGRGPARGVRPAAARHIRTFDPWSAVKGFVSSESAALSMRSPR
jgi:hypothetical protein